MTSSGLRPRLAACRQTKRVRFYKTAALANELQLAQRKLTLSDLTAKFVKLNLLVLDELGFIAIDQEGAQLLFQLVSDLSERVSLIVNRCVLKGGRRIEIMGALPHMAKGTFLTLMRTSSAAFEVLLESLSEEQLTTPGVTGSWSVNLGMKFKWLES